MDEQDADRRVARLHQQNPLSPAAPPPATYAAAPVKQSKVGRGGTIHIGQLEPGVRVNVLQVEPQTFVVSARPEREIREIAAGMPKVGTSRFAALSAAVRGRTHEAEPQRTRGAYTGPISVEPISDDEVLATSDTERTRRLR